MEKNNADFLINYNLLVTKTKQSSMHRRENCWLFCQKNADFLILFFKDIIMRFKVPVDVVSALPLPE